LPDEAVKQKRKRLWARRILLRKANWLVCPSQNLLRIARRQWWLAERKIRFIPNGVDTQLFKPGSRTAARQQLGLPADALVVGTVGHLRAEKNQERLLRAFAGLAATGKAVLLLVGGGPLRDHLGSLAAELGVASKVIFPGVIQQPVGWYQAMDLFALSSDTEQMPIALLEAMAVGLPVVATDVGDVRVMVEPSSAPFVTRLGDEVAFRQALETLAADQKLRTRLGASNRCHCESYFSLGGMIESYRRMYAEGAGCAELDPRQAVGVGIPGSPHQEICK
jgi:glycosyltransferase involved in cell wall biosynthesis